MGELDGRHPRLGMAIEGEQPRLAPTGRSTASTDGSATAPDSSARAARRRVGSPSAPTTTSRSNICRTAARSSSSSDAVEQLGPRGDGAVDPAQLAVGGQREALVRAALGQLVERELQRRQRGRLVDDGADQLGDQRPLDAARRRARPARRSAASSSAGDIAAIVDRRLVDGRPEAAGRRAAGRRSRRAGWPPPAAGCRAPRRRASGRRGTPAGPARWPG